jgi:hypothetical protein
MKVNSRGVGAKGREEQEALKGGRRTGGEDKKKKKPDSEIARTYIYKEGAYKTQGYCDFNLFLFLRHDDLMCKFISNFAIAVLPFWCVT